MALLVTMLSELRLHDFGKDTDTLIGTVHYARTGDYDPEAPRKGSLDRAIHAIAIVGKSSHESDEIYFVAPLSNHWPDKAHKVPAGEYVMGGTGEIHTGVPYRIRKEKIRIAHDGGQKVLKPGALEKLRTIMLENEASAPMPGVQQQPAQERPIDAQSQCICGGSQRGRRFGGRGSRGRNTMKYRIGAHFGNF
ncbi:hypothetical protein AX14_000926 [Amanita brunnescens Koide BX004]|nr:hypothetical protein AX14_000926 [Amanita brunnescens Koide BX004]